MGVINKILVIRLSSIGDIVLITPVLRALHRGFPQAELWVLVKEEYAPILNGNPHITGIIPLEAKGKHSGIRGLMGLIRNIRSKGFNLVIDLHVNLRSLFITTLMRGPRVFRYRKRWWQRRALVYWKWFPVGSRHTVDLYLDSLRPLGMEGAEVSPEVYLDEGDIQFAQDFLQRIGITGDRLLIGMNVGASWPTKRWTAAGFSSVGDRLMKEYGARVLLFGDGEDQQFRDEVASRMLHHPILPPQGLSLGQLTALIDRCSLLVTNDSGPMHLAVARGVPVVAIFGPTHPKLGFSPLGPRDVVLTKNLNCSPCSLHGKRQCPRTNRECMESITPEEVLSAIERLLKESEITAVYNGRGDRPVAPPS